jgi:hypothetical protein
MKSIQLTSAKWGQEEDKVMKTNEGTVDRALRVALGVALIAVGFAWVQGTAGIVVGTVGFVPLLTGLVGWCPIYALLKIDTLKVRLFGGAHDVRPQSR